MIFKNNSISVPFYALISLGCLIIATIIDEIVIISLMFSIIEENFDPLAIAWLFFWQMVPAILVAPFAGLLIDQNGARIIIIIAGISQMLVLFWLSFSETLFEIYLISALLSCHVSFTGPAIFALIAPMSRLANLSIQKTNILLEGTRSLGTIIGPAIGGMAIGLLNIQLTIMAASLWFGVFVIVIYLTNIDTAQTSDRKRNFYFNTISTSYLPIMRQKSVLIILIVFGAIVFATSFSDVLFVFFTLGPLEGSSMTVGFLIAIWSVGLLLGAAALNSKSNSKESRSHFNTSIAGAIIMGGALVFCGLSAVLFSPFFAFLLVLFLFFIGGFGNGIHNVSVRNVIYIEVPEGQHGRAFSLYIAITRIGALLGFLLGGLISSTYAIEGYLFSGFLAVFAGGTGFLLRNHIFLDRKEP